MQSTSSSHSQPAPKAQAEIAADLASALLVADATASTDVAERRVLMIGGATYTDAVICPLARHVRNSGRYVCSVMGAGQQTGRPIKYDYSAFDAMAAFPCLRTRPQSLPDALRLSLDAATCILSPRVWAGAMSATLACAWDPLRKAIRAKLYDNEYSRTVPRLAANYDIYHWHCLHPSRLAALRYLPANANIIISILGSDLLRTSGVDEYRAQLAAAERATIVTMASAELREVFLAKFGRRFQDKMRLAGYGADYLDQCETESGRRDEFLARIGIPRDKRVVCVGHNAFEDNQHLGVLESLRLLDRAQLDQIALILPMTYGSNAAYRERVQAAAERLSVVCRALVEPLSAEEVAMLRVASDIFVHVPVSDQFSAAMCESLYAGAVLITGSWLPYSRLRTNGIYHHEVADVADVAATLRRVLADFDAERAKTVGAAEKIRRIMAWERVVPRWLEIYDEILAVQTTG